MSKKPIYNSKMFRRYSTRFWWFKKISKKEIKYITNKKNLINKKKPQHFHKRLRLQKTLSIFYGGISRKQLRFYYIKALYLPGRLGSIIFQSIESRLDVSLFRSSLVLTMQAAKQFIKHRRVLVNQRPAVTPGFSLKPGDIVSINKKHFDSFNNSIKTELNSFKTFIHPKANHLEINSRILTFIFLFLPQQIAIPYRLEKLSKKLITKQPLFDIYEISQCFYPLKK